MRHLTTFALAGLFGGLLLVGDASACHKKKCACPAPAPVCAPAPVAYCPPPAPACAPAPKHHFKMPKMSLHHKKAATCAAPVSYGYAPVAYSAPIASPQATPQAH